MYNKLYIYANEKTGTERLDCTDSEYFSTINSKFA